MISDKSKISKKGLILIHSLRIEGHGELVIFHLVRKQREMDAYYWLNFHFLFSLGPQSMEMEPLILRMVSLPC